MFLATERKIAPGSIAIAVAAVRFLYRVTLKTNWDVEEAASAPKRPKQLTSLARSGAASTGLQSRG